MMVNQWLAVSLLTGLLLGCGGGTTDEGTTVNKPPVAQADQFNTLENTQVTLSVLANDVEPESEAMTIQSATVSAAQGTVSVNSSDKKTLLFTPKTSFLGDADITYTIADTQGHTASAHAIVSVKALQSLSARQDSTCAVTSTGTVKCWGGNDFGQLGNTVTNNCTGTDAKCEAKPVTVANLNDAKQVAVGYNHACAITGTGSVKCWGDNSRGQIGDGTTTARAQATAVIGLSAKVTQLALTYQSSCALLETGAVQCWGGNSQGELGVGQTAKITQSSTPQNTVLLNNISLKRLVSGRQHLCGITNSDTLVCWGWNDFGQLGLNNTTAQLIPVVVSAAGTGIQQVAAGYGHTCVARANETLCWGDNSKGQLGDGTVVASSMNPVTPVVLSLANVSELALGKEHSCATNTTNETFCWGSRQVGQTAQAVDASNNTPMLVAGLTAKHSMSAGDFHSCSMGDGGTVKCWGNNDLGQLGDDSVATVKASASLVTVKNLP